MPPKNSGASKKTQEKQKQKIVEDKTFGIKNKKGAKQQKFIQQVQKQVQQKGQPNRRDVPNPAEEREKRKEEERKKKEELSMLFKPVIAAQTVAKGVDPKSVLCVFFKQGLCQKGDKCKFSHDLTQERKAEKRSIYDDTREKEETDTMDKWDEEKLEDVINKKHGEDNKRKNATQIVCKYFIEAVENSTYGWFWQCPNEKDDGKCLYRHALPPGFQLKSDRKKGEETEEIVLETLIEKERASLGSNVTKVTLESFLAWKKRKIEEKKSKAQEADDKKKRDYKLGFMNGLTGRDMFTFNPDLITNDADEANNDIDYKQRVDEDGEDKTSETDSIKQSIYEINAAQLASQAREVDGTGTLASADRFDYIKTLLNREQKKNEDIGKLDIACGGADDIRLDDVEENENENDDDDDDDDDGGSDENDENNESNSEVDEINGNKNFENSSSVNRTKTKQNIEIDESLFTLEDLGNIQDELENLDI